MWIWLHEALDWEALHQRLAAEAYYYAPRYNLYFSPPKPENPVRVWLDQQGVVNDW